MSLRIATLTANPSVDVCVSVDRVEPVRKLRCGPPRRDPGGGGLNAARVIRRLGGRPTAILAAGGPTGRRLAELLSAERMAARIVQIAGETREDFTAAEALSGDQYRFVLPGPRVTAAEARTLLQTCAELEPKPDIVLASGSLPPGAPTTLYGQLATRVRDAGGRFAVDASGKALRHALAAGVWLAKPNLQELQELSGRPLTDTRARIYACQDLIRRGSAEIVALTLGAEGALLVCPSGVWRAPALRIAAVSAVGAGDSFMGALLWAHAAGQPLVEALRWAMAAGAAALIAPGTQLCRVSDTRRLRDQVRTHPA